MILCFLGVGMQLLMKQHHAFCNLTEAMELAEQKEKINTDGEVCKAVGKFGRQGKMSYHYTSYSGRE